MISHEHKCIFIHQRKCAGVSIIHSFGITSPENPDWHFMNDGVLSHDYHVRPPDYHRFTVVRNPWDRFVSGWLYCEDTRHVPLRDLLRNLPLLGHDYVHLTRLQRDVLYDQVGYLVVEDLVRFESLQADFDRVCDKIRKPRAKLPELNRQSHPPYQTYFASQIDRDLFRRHFQRDLDAFGYDF